MEVAVGLAILALSVAGGCFTFSRFTGSFRRRITLAFPVACLLASAISAFVCIAAVVLVGYTMWGM